MSQASFGSQGGEGANSSVGNGRASFAHGAAPSAGPGKSIILFSDGTGNSSAKLFKTNVWRMYEALDLGPAGPDRRKQIAFYDNGVGTSALRPLAMLGGIFGFGLKRNILQIYRYACRNYTPAPGQTPGTSAVEGGDDIWAFGFSRGAFTIRLVVALIASQGLVAARDERELIRRSADAYRAFRSAFLPRRLQSPTRLWRQFCSLLRGAFRRARGVEPYDPQLNYRATIRFVGAWDTVAAYGGPIVEITRGIDDWLYALSMPDYCLHRDVRCARHALAIDDERDAFHPLLWDEVHEERLIEEGTVAPDRLRQVWFTGMHADVGGGYPDESLSYVSFLWMLSEAEAAGLRSLTAVTDRYRALANSEGPMHDSRAGFGAYYRYQPRNIGAWLDPPVTESIVQDPDLRSPCGRPQGLLTRVDVHESVIARIESGTDDYAPFTLPADIRIVPPHAGGENTPQADSETPQLPPAEERPVPLISSHVRERVEDPIEGRKRAAAMGTVWDLVWYRRVYYFATLLLTLALLSMPVWVTGAPEPPVLADGRNWAGGLIRLFALATPDFLDPAIDSMADNSFYFLLLIIVISLLMWRSTATELRLRDRTRELWGGALAGEELPVEAPPLLQRLRTSRLYRRPLRTLKWKVLPGVSAALLVLIAGWLLLGAYAQLRLVGLERGEALCRRSGAATALTVAQITFSPASACQPVGASVLKGQRYIIDLVVIEPWRDGSIAASPAGLAAADLGPAGYAAIPFRRVITANYLQPLMEIRRSPGSLGGGDRVHIEALEFRQQGDRPNTWRAEFEAARSGELLIFANEAVLPFRTGGSAADYLYRSPLYGNRGSACLTIRRADLAGASARPGGGEACMAAARASAPVSAGAPLLLDRLSAASPSRGGETSGGASATGEASGGRASPTAILVLQDILRFFATFLAAAFIVGLIVAASLNLLRPFVRVLYQAWGVRRWVSIRATRSLPPLLARVPDWFAASLRDAGKERVFKSLAVTSASFERLAAKAHRPLSPGLLAAAGIQTRPGLLADDLFMHALELEARAALMQPSSNPKLFAILSAYAPADAQALMLAVDLLARLEPAEAYRLIAPVEAGDAAAPAPAHAIMPDPVQSASDAAIGAAEAAVTTAGERALDELQLSLESAGLLFDRLLALALGIAAALAVTFALETPVGAMLPVVGVAGGLLGLLGSDALRGLRLAGASGR